MGRVPVVISQPVGIKQRSVSVESLIPSAGIARLEIGASLEAAFWHLVDRTELDYYREVEALLERKSDGKIWRFVRKGSGMYSAENWTLVEETT